MAFFDDRRFLLSHIHHSFITCDDTGMCEMVMVNEVVTDKPVSKVTDEEDDPDGSLAKVFDYYSSALDSDFLEGGQSYDIVSDMALIGAHRHRSNTAQRLERLKKERLVQAKIKSVPWKSNSNPFSESELSELFPKKEVPKHVAKPKKSALSAALECLPEAPNNPFNEYTRFDGRISHVAQTKKIMIFLTMLPPGERDYPMEVVSLASARVQDLIGLICWQYTNERKEPKLKIDASKYSLRIAEETGEVDEDFPCLDPKELVAKFGFPMLAFVEKEPTDDNLILVTMYIEDEFTQLEVPSLDISLKDVIEQIRRHRKWLSNAKDFHIEKKYEPEIALSLDQPIRDFGSLEFRLVRSEISPKDHATDDWDFHHMIAMGAPLYQSYNVSFIQKVGRNYDIQLGISGEKVEINPLPQKGAAKLLTRQQKAATYYMDTIVACEIVSRKYNGGKTIFHLIQQSGQDFKAHLFETDYRTSQEIVKKIQAILDMHPSASRKEYQSYREKKLQKKLHRNSQGFTSFR